MTASSPTKRQDTRDFLRENGPDVLRQEARRTMPFNFGNNIPPAIGNQSIGQSYPVANYPSTLVPLNDDASPAVESPATGLEHPESGQPPVSPLPLDEDLPDTPFPVHCIPGVAGEMTREIARVTTAQNLPLAAASVLGVLSASLGAGLEVSSGGERWVRANLYILAIAESGTGKGEAFGLAAAPIDLAESEAMERFKMSKEPDLIAELNVADSRAKDLGKRTSREDDPVKRRRLLIEVKAVSEEIAKLQRQLNAAPRLRVADTTKEALGKIMSGQPGEAIASLSSEARGVLSILKGRYGKEGGDEDFYCSCYSGESIPADRIGRGHVPLRRPCLCVLWMVQPDAARNAFADEALTESGFLARCLTFDPKAEPLERDADPAPIPKVIKNGWTDLVTSLLGNYRVQGSTPKTVTVAEGVADVMRAYENENVRLRQRRGEMHDLAKYVARWTENAWRMALVLHGAKHGNTAHKEELEVDTARNAIEILRWFTDRQMELLAAGRNAKARSRVSTVLAVLEEAGGEISLRDLRRSHSIDREEINRLQAKFPGQFKIVERKNVTGGRPSEVLTNRPEVMQA